MFISDTLTPQISFAANFRFERAGDADLGETREAREVVRELVGVPVVEIGGAGPAVEEDGGDGASEGGGARERGEGVREGVFDDGHVGPIYQGMQGYVFAVLGVLVLF